MTKTRKTARKAKEPEVGSDQWYAREQEKPGFALAEMKNLCNMIAQGHPTAVGMLDRWMMKSPDVARELALDRLGDLCANAEAEWMKALVGDNPLDQMGVKDQIAAMKAELVGEKPSILEKILVSNLIVAHLAHHRAVLWAARPAQQQAVATARERRVESASRWFLLAVKSLAVVRQQQARGLVPKTKLKLFDASATASESALTS